MERRIEWLRADIGDDHAHLPVIHLDSGKPGKTAIVTANVHGDESSGVVAVHAIDRWLQDNLERGKVQLYPSLNPRALALNTRRVPHDGADLNRCFPGRAKGTASERLAHAVWRSIEAANVDLLIDLHTDSTGSIPYTIIDRAVALSGRARQRLDRQLLALGRETGLTVLLEFPDDLYMRFGLDRSLAGAVVNHLRTPAITVEAGPRGVVDWDAVGIMRRAVQGVLAQAGLVDGAPPPDPSRVDCTTGVWRRGSTARTRRPGVFVPSLRPGDRFRPGAVLGVVRDLAGDPLDEVRAQSDGVVVSWIDSPWVESGQVVGTIGIAEVA